MLYEKELVKYLRIQFDKKLIWKQDINPVILKLNKANAILSKIGHVLDIKTLRSVYYAIFGSRLCYVSLAWAQKSNSLKRPYLLRKTSSRILLFYSRNSHRDLNS